MAAPNPRLQRTPAASPPSPLSRKPFGARVSLRRFASIAGLVAIALIVSQPSVADDASGWRKFAPADGGFSILMPGDVSEQSDPKVGTRTFQVRVDDESAYIVTSAILLPELKALGTEKLLRQMRDQFTESMKASNLESESISREGFPAAKWTFNSGIPGRPVFRMRMITVVTSKRLFNFGVILRKESFREADVERFLKSFQLEASGK